MPISGSIGATSQSEPNASVAPASSNDRKRIRQLRSLRADPLLRPMVLLHNGSTVGGWTAKQIHQKLFSRRFRVPPEVQVVIVFESDT
jgi:hypothetical protein